MILYRYFLRTTFFQGNITFHLFLLYIVLMILYRYFLRTNFFQGNITFHLFLLYIVLIILYRYFLRTTFFQGNITFHLFLLYIVVVVVVVDPTPPTCCQQSPAPEIMWQPAVSPPRWQGKAPLCRDSSRGPG